MILRCLFEDERDHHCEEDGRFDLAKSRSIARCHASTRTSRVMPSLKADIFEQMQRWTWISRWDWIVTSNLHASYPTDSRYQYRLWRLYKMKPHRTISLTYKRCNLSVLSQAFRSAWCLDHHPACRQHSPNGPRVRAKSHGKPSSKESCPR